MKGILCMVTPSSIKTVLKLNITYSPIASEKLNIEQMFKLRQTLYCREPFRKKS